MSSEPVATPDPIPPRSRTGEVLREAHGIGRWLTSLNEKQVMVLLVIVLMLFVCGMFGWSSFMQMKQAVEIRNAEMRGTAEREELMRQNCSIEKERDRLHTLKEKEADRIESEKVRQFFANQAELQRRHDDEMEEKSRAVISAMMAQIARLELAYLKGKSP